MCVIKSPRHCLWLAWLLSGGVVLPAVGAAESAAPATPPPRAALIRFEGVITPLLEQFLYRKLQAAEEAGVEVVIIEIDSPGGLLESSFNVAECLRDLKWAETVAYVPREALSGGAIVALGCDKLLMGANARLGDAGPITQGEDSLYRHAPEKIRTDLVRRMRDLALAKRRPPALAEAMVDLNAIVFQVTNRQTGAKALMTEHDLASAENPADWEKGPPLAECRPGVFLEVNGQRAVELHLADAQAANRQEVTRLLKVSEELQVFQATAVDTTVAILNSPWITGLLFVIGLVALYLEFHVPGMSVGGLIAALCFTLFFWSRFLGGTAEVLEVILFVAGVVFLAVEVFVLPGFGVAGVTGVLLMFVAVMMASQGFAIPQTGRQFDTFAQTLLVVACSGAAFLAVAAWLRRYFGSLPLLNRLALDPAPPVLEAVLPGADLAVPPPPAGVVPNAPTRLEVGARGVSISPLRPAGKARFGDDYRDVITDGAFVDSGRAIKAVEVCGSRIVVEEL